MAAKPRSEGPYVIDFIETHCRLTQGEQAGDLVQLLPFQKQFINELFELRQDNRRRYRRAYVQMPRKNGKTYLLACVALYAALLDEIGGEIYFVAGDRQQASRAFEICKRVIEMDPELSSLFKPFRYHVEVPSTGTILRVLSADAELQQGLTPSFTVADEVAVYPNDRLWNTMSLGSGTRSQPMLIGISTPGWEKESLAYKLYQHGHQVRSGELEDPSFYFKAWEPEDPDCDYRDPAVWAAANPAMGSFLHEEDFHAALTTTPEHEFRRFRLGMWTETRDAALPSGAWEACADRTRIVRDGESIVVGFDGSATRDCTVLVGCTLDRHLFLIQCWEPTKQNRVDPRDVAEALRQTWKRYDVRETTCDEYLYAWVLLQLEAEERQVIAAAPQRERNAVAGWQLFSDAVIERRLTHDGNPTLARHIQNLTLKSDRLGLRPTRDRSSPRSFIDAAMAAIWAYHRVNYQPEPGPIFAAEWRGPAERPLILSDSAWETTFR